MKFKTIGEAHVALSSLHGRFFAGKQVEGEFIPEGLYRSRFPSL